MKAGSPDPAQGYDRSSLWLFHSAVQNCPASKARDRNRGRAAPVLIQRLEPRAAASAERPAEAKPAQAPDFPRRASRAGCGLHTRSGNAAFRRQPPQTAKTGRGLHTAPIPGPTAARSDVAKVAEGGGVDACLPAQRRGTFYNSLSLNDPPNTDRPSIDRNLESALEVPRHQHLATKISQTKVS